MKGLFNLSLSGSEERNLGAERQKRQRRNAVASIFRCRLRRRFALADSHVIVCKPVTLCPQDSRWHDGLTSPTGEQTADPHGPQGLQQPRQPSTPPTMPHAQSRTPPTRPQAPETTGPTMQNGAHTRPHTFRPQGAQDGAAGAQAGPQGAQLGAHGVMHGAPSGQPYGRQVQ